MTKWEYAQLTEKTHDKNLVKTLNQWGDVGWEIIAVFLSLTASAEYTTFYFKRPR
jgi:hypothetical protein